MILRKIPIWKRERKRVGMVGTNVRRPSHNYINCCEWKQSARKNEWTEEPNPHPHPDPHPDLGLNKQIFQKRFLIFSTVVVVVAIIVGGRSYCLWFQVNNQKNVGNSRLNRLIRWATRLKAQHFLSGLLSTLRTIIWRKGDADLD